MIAVISVKPQYAEKILKGEKKYEFRKKMFKKPVSEILVYVTKPIGKISLRFRVGVIVEDSVSTLWKRFGKFSGMEKQEFFDYYKGYKRGVAIEIRDVEKVERDTTNLNLAPQSWFYI